MLQRNGFSLIQTNLQLLGHYRVAGPWFASAGFVARTLEGRYSVAVRDSMHVGLWGKWSVTHRPRQTLGLAELPLSRMTGLNYGIELLWKL